MSPEGARWIRMGIQALVGGVITVNGILYQAVSSEGKIPWSAVTAAALLGATSALINLQSYLAQPPPSLGGTALPAVQTAPLAPQLPPVTWEAKRDAFLAGHPKET